MIILLIIAIIFTVFYNYYKNRDLYSAGEKFPGPKAFPILGNSLDFAYCSYGIFSKFNEFSNKYGRFFRIWNNGKLYVVCNQYIDAEVFLSSNVYLKKSDLYKFFYPWIGDGLVSSQDINLWRKHRKIITPTFHFKILQDFLETFNQNTQILCDKLESLVGKGLFDITPYIKLAALDNICETALGVNMNAQKNSDNEYVKAIKDITNIMVLRFFKVWLMIDVFFYLSKYRKIQNKALKILHETTNKLIRERRAKIKMNELEPNNKVNSDQDVDERKKLAFMDLLLESEEGSRLSDKEVREEVNTFTFAGQDTVSSAMCFSMYCLAENENIQEAAYKEQVKIFGHSNRSPTFADIQEMKYLERVLKEVLRLYPSAPIIGRELLNDLYLPGNYFLPKGTQIMINIYAIHRDPNVWSDPEKFNPDNFLPEAALSKNPYAYIPFSAGPRNCIGQKYAMLSLKATISMILRKFKILPSPHVTDKPHLAAEIVLTSVNGINIQLEFRNK